MPSYSPELIQTMRAALDEVMTKIPLDQATPGIKAHMAEFILNDPFWMSQVAQINITEEKNFEMIPTVGNHLVKLGNGEDIEKKFHRLFVFYKEILSKTGFNEYKTIDIEYAGQVVADKGKSMSKVDMAQLKKNVDKLLTESQKMESDTTFTTNGMVKQERR